MSEQPGKAEGVAWLVIGGIICFLAWRVKLGSFIEPGPGFIAFAGGAFLAAIGLIMIFSRAVLVKTGEAISGAHGLRYVIPGSRLGYTIGLLLAYALLLNGLGYILITFFQHCPVTFLHINRLHHHAYPPQYPIRYYLPSWMPHF